MNIADLRYVTLIIRQRKENEIEQEISPYPVLRYGERGRGSAHVTWQAHRPRTQTQNMHIRPHPLYPAITQFLGSEAPKHDYYSHPIRFFFSLGQ